MMNLRVTVSFQTLRSPRVRPRPFTPLAFFPHRRFLDISRLALSVSLALHHILLLLSLSDLGSSARRSSPAAGGLPLSSPHRGAPRLPLPARARRGGPSSAAPNRALASELAVEEGDEILHGRLLELAVEEEARAGEEARLVVRVVLLSAASLGIRF